MSNTHILGDSVPRKSNFDPDLARKVTKYYEEHPEELEDSPAPSLTVNNTSSPLEVIKGNYLTAIQAAIPETIQTSAELQKSLVELNARNDYSMNNLTFYTANIHLYGVENGKPFLLFGKREAFLRLYVPYINDVYTQINIQKDYILPSADKAWALGEGIRSDALKRFDLAELNKTRYDNEFGYLVINSNNPAQLKGAKRELAELIHGQGNDYFECLKVLAEKGLSETRVWLLNPDFVSSLAGNNLIGRASKLGSFINNSSFFMDNRDVSEYNSLRGVRLGAAGTAPKNGGTS